MKKKQIIVSGILFICGLIGLIMSFYYNSMEQFLYYTQLSNYSLFIINGVYLYYLLFKDKVPNCIKKVLYIVSCLTGVTFIVVIFILMPMYKSVLWLLFNHELVFHHTLNPILAIINLSLIKDYKVDKKDNLLAVMPTVVYGVVMIIVNLLRLYEGPYGFLLVYKQPWYMSILWFVLIMGIAYFIAWVLRLIVNKK